MEVSVTGDQTGAIIINLWANLADDKLMMIFPENRLFFFVVVVFLCVGKNTQQTKFGIFFLEIKTHRVYPGSAGHFSYFSLKKTQIIGTH